jgi:hypothetical protein
LTSWKDFTDSDRLRTQPLASQEAIARLEAEGKSIRNWSAIIGGGLTLLTGNPMFLAATVGGMFGGNFARAIAETERDAAAQTGPSLASVGTAGLVAKAAKLTLNPFG